jgi:DNA-binding beta-propeller fold protein YncE
MVAALLAMAATAGASPLGAGNVHLVKNVQVGDYPEGVAVDAATNRLYVADDATEYLDVLNATTGKMLTRIHVGIFPYLVAVDPTRDHVFVVDYADGRRTPVVEINGRTDKIIGTVLVGAYPEAVEFDPSTGALLVTAENHLEGYVYLINTKGRTPKLVRSFGVATDYGIYADQLAVDTQTHTFYVTNDAVSGIIWKINASTFATSTYSGVGSFPLAPFATGNTLWLESSMGGHYVLDQQSASDPDTATGEGVILPQYGYFIDRNAATHTTYLVDGDEVYAVRAGAVTSFNTGVSYANDVVFDQRDGDLFIVNGGREGLNEGYSGNVVIVRGLAVTQTVPTGNYSDYAALNPGTGRVYVTNSDGATVSILQAPVG